MTQVRDNQAGDGGVPSPAQPPGAAAPPPAAEPAPEVVADFTTLQAPRRVRAAWVAAPDTPSALGRVLQPLAIGLMDEMVEVTALCPEEADVRELPSPPVEVLPYGRPPWWAFRDRTLDYLADQLKRRRVDLVHALEGPVADLARDLANLLGVPYLVNSLALDPNLWQVRAEHNAWAVLAASEIIRSDLLAKRVSTEAQTRLVRPAARPARRAR